ncbi:MAG: transposase [Thermodesulfobacteriota bacterium]|nr:transposase [Thermodesulfobacteriota bacterium]
MARAKRHYIPGQIWHITHRCHKREFLFKFSKDRHLWLQWLYQARKRYGLTILNYIVTSNHIHLLVKDDGDRDTIPRSMQLIAGRTGQAYNQRKKRQGAFWEDRYHATAVETGDHFLRCLVYIDLNMVRTGVVKHPAEWPFSGYNEIQNPKRKNILIHYKMLMELCGAASYEALKHDHKALVEECLRADKQARDEKWTQSVAVGSQGYVERIKKQLGALASGRTTRQTDETIYRLQEPHISYNGLFRGEKNDIGGENGYIWDIFD